LFIGGLQELTLTDFPKKVACIVFLVNCNFKCKFCYNKELTSFKLFKKSERHLIPAEEFFSFLESKKDILDGVVVTGGEPTVCVGIEEFLRKIKSMGFLVKLDTNGSNPHIIKKLFSEKLVDYVAMDVKTTPKKYKSLTHSTISPTKILESIELVKSSNIPFEFRTTLQPKIKVSDFKEMAQLIEHSPWFLQHFQASQAMDASYRKLKPLTKEQTNALLDSVKGIASPKLRVN
jgi:pyruvate formate lyase activating enzyme